MKLNRFLVVVVAASEVNERSFNGSRIGEKLMMTTAGKRNRPAYATVRFVDNQTVRQDLAVELFR
jgi:hypothetical protein